MRWVRLGTWSGVLGAALLAACGSSSSFTGGDFGTGGSANGGTAVSSGGALNLGGAASTGAQPSGLDSCFAPVLRFPVVRYSTADVDASLDQVFGKGARLADAFVGEETSVGFVRALIGIARIRVVEAAKDADELEVCDDADDQGPSCIQSFLRDYGGKLYRRPLEPQQLAGYLAPFRSTADRRAAAENALVAMVLSPYFNLRLETATSGRLDDYGIAARVAHFATRSVPDAELTAAAAGGHLTSPLERLSQLHRLWGTAAGRAARTQFALELLHLQDPKDRNDLAPELGRDLSAQTAALVDYVYDEQFGSFAALLGTSGLALNDRLADFYGVPRPGHDELQGTELDPAFFSGLLSLGAFTTRYRHPSARGFAIMEHLLCTDMPSPPPMHDFALPPDVPARDGLAQALEGQVACSACHKLFDPPGLALSAFDADGRLGDVDSSGAVQLSPLVETTPVSDPRELSTAIADSEEARICLERRYLTHVLGRELEIDGQIFVRVLLPPGGAPLPSSMPDGDWITCMENTLGSSAANLTLLSEAIVQSNLMLMRDDTPRRVVALDSSGEPREHALAETEQLLGSYPNPDDDDALSLYLAALEAAGAAVPPVGAGGDGAGGAP